MLECKFCRKTKKNLIKAHIIPQAFVRKKAKEYGTDLIVVAKGKNNKEKRKGDGYRVDKDGTVRIQSNGYFDPNILCDECDRKFGKCEDKLITFLIDSIDVNKYDYRSISLAIKGILWKAHITTNQEFTHIDLGKKYGDVLYNCLLLHLDNKDKIPPQDFPIWIQRYKNVLGNSKNDVIFNMINNGSKNRDECHGILYRFDFSGHRIIIRVGGEPLTNLNQFIANDKANISEVVYRFSGNVNDIFNPNPSIIKAFHSMHLQ